MKKKFFLAIIIVVCSLQDVQAVKKKSKERSQPALSDSSVELIERQNALRIDPNGSRVLVTAPSGKLEIWYDASKPPVRETSDDDLRRVVGRLAGPLTARDELDAKRNKEAHSAAGKVRK